MLYLGIFILSWGWKIKFHGDRPSRKSIWTNLDPKSSIFLFLQFLVHFVFRFFFVPLAGNVVLCQCHSIAHVLALYFLVKADLSDLFSRDKMDPRQKGARTKWIQDDLDPGQHGSRTIWIQDKRDQGQEGSRTLGIKDIRDPGQNGTRT